MECKVSYQCVVAMWDVGEATCGVKLVLCGVKQTNKQTNNKHKQRRWQELSCPEEQSVKPHEIGLQSNSPFCLGRFLTE